jgi:hypothetical protein
MPQMSLETANVVYNVSWWITLIAAVLTVVGIITNMKSSAARDFYADKRISDNERDAAAAVADAARANEATAKANLETEKLRAEMAWRELTRAQYESMRAALHGTQHSITVGYLAGNNESQAFAGQFMELFQLAGWDARLVEKSPFGVIVTGILVTGPARSTVRLFGSAMTSAGLEWHEGPMPPSSISVNEPLVPPEVMMLIGSKPSPSGFQGRPSDLSAGRTKP